LHRTPSCPLFSFRPRLPPTPTLFPYTTLFRSPEHVSRGCTVQPDARAAAERRRGVVEAETDPDALPHPRMQQQQRQDQPEDDVRSEEHTSELQSRSDLVCRLLLEKKKHKQREP